MTTGWKKTERTLDSTIPMVMLAKADLLTCWQGAPWGFDSHLDLLGQAQGECVDVQVYSGG